MDVLFKLSHHRHSGRLRPHEHTSYLPLLLLLLAVGFVLTVGSAQALSHPDPQSGSVGLSGSMPGQPPKKSPTITAPSPAQHFTTSPVTISGTCQANTLVEVYKNDIFAGSVGCTDKGTFSVDVDLMVGENRLVARLYDDLNQAGPDSNAVIVYYDALPAQAAGIVPLNFGGDQLLLNTDAVFRGSFPNQEFNVPISVIGGTPPYAINTQWGDNANKVISRNDNLTFNVAHAYKKAGTYQITLQATDAQGRVAFLAVAAIINGQPAGVTAAGTSSAGGTRSIMGKLLVLWPLYTSAVAVTISFWLGERREKRVLGQPQFHLSTHL